MSSVTCQSCGRIDKHASRFCPSCGEKLAAGNDENTDAFEIIEAIPHEYDRSQFPESCGLFVIESGPKAGARYGLEDDLITIGRHSDAGIFLDDITVSRRHAQVERVGERYVVKDAGSLNGTYVNRERIDSVELHEGDEVQIGRFRLVFFHGIGS
tara:strand:+ start:53 stop:517 length:465 start_codon:yes stop_codon:yes gene_type:complete